ncbi:uncharacterized protein LOC127881286 isoform X2 [Dreissena polymorpha]|uniref:uncharacterized protein LOC127881286 isoform X2 n=1 Tax=Dreissena polymorpha TaxID=45954 RepID=UPI002264C994|nr:uncharacterized protein LOC127881286 isoform X2 [Dreissena polymorpha]
MMNVILLHGVLSERYNTCYKELRNKVKSRLKQGPVCCNSNHLASRPVGSSMQKSLKLKLQYALSKPAADAETPAVFVGGRRRNRKKRKPKHGQTKKKRNEMSTVPPVLNRSFAPDFEYYQDVVRPAAKVTCVDIEEPVFTEEPKQVYPTRRDSGCDEDFEDDSEPAITMNTSTPMLKDICRTHSRDSGVYDGDVTIFTDDVTSDSGLPDEQTSDEGIASMVEANVSKCSAESVEHGDRRKDVQDDIADDITADDIAADENANRHLDSTEEQFDEIDLDSEYEDERDPTLDAVPLSVELAEAYAIDGVEQETAAEATDEQGNVGDNADRFLKLDEDEVIFDLSQLEVNNTERELSTIERWRQQLRQNNEKSGWIFDPTVLESDEPIQVHMDLLIDDDKDDEVLYEAGGSRRDLNITCNPLYEHTLKDEETEKISLKNFQSGFKTDFDNVNFIQIPTKPGGKKTKESSPLLKNGESENADEIVCCTIL